MVSCVHHNNYYKKMSKYTDKGIRDEDDMSADNLVLRNGTYHVRVRVPPELHKIMGRNEFTKSLKTGSKAEANVKKLPIIQAIRAEIEKFKTQVKPAEVYDLYEHTHNFSESNKKEEQISIKEILENGKTDEWYYKGFFIDDCAEMLIRGFDKPLINGKAKTPKRIAHEKKVIENLAEWKKRWNEYVERNGKLSVGVQIEASSELTEIWEDKFVDLLEHKGKKLTPTETSTVSEIIKDPAFFTPNTEFTDSRLESFLAYQINIRKVIQKTVDVQVSRLKTLREFLTKNKLELNHKSIRNWLDAEQKLTAKTKKQYILSGNTFWKWALKNDQAFEKKYENSAAPFQGHEFPINRKGKADVLHKRKTYTVEQIELLFSKATELEGKNRQPLMDAIRIAVYSGMRIEEICKIKIARDLVDDEGVYSFSLDEGKNESAIRKIPVHPNLLPVIERMKNESKDGFLMPSPAGNKYDIRSDYLSKAFGRLKTANGFGRQHVFHCFRGTVITQFQRADVSALTIVSIAGHEAGFTTFDIYSAGASPAQKQKAIQTINYYSF